MDLDLSIYNGFNSPKIYDKCDDFDYDKVNFLLFFYFFFFFDADVPRFIIFPKFHRRYFDLVLN